MASLFQSVRKWPIHRADQRQDRVLFHRDFRNLTGGHLKVYHYFQHVRSISGFVPEIYFSPETVWDEGNPWKADPGPIHNEWRPDLADILFLAGRDWEALSQEQCWDPPAPVINLIQHVRHADPEEPLFKFLEYPALRICVSQEVADAIRATGKVNGTIEVIPNGVNLPDPVKARRWSARRVDVLICGRKRPQLAREVAKKLEKKLSCEVLTGLLPRAEYLDRVANARVVVALPNETEGFYLPALEAMALGSLLVTLDCVGNRGFCHDRDTCLIPKEDPDAILNSALEALRLPKRKQAAMRRRALKVAKRHSLKREREMFCRVLREIDDLTASRSVNP